MGGVSEQRHPPERPARDRIAVAHRELEELPRGPDDLDGVDHRQLEGTVDLGHQLVGPPEAVPVLTPGRPPVTRAEPGRHRPVQQVGTGRRRLEGDGVEREPRLPHPADDDHRPTGQDRRVLDDPAPQHDPVPGRRPFARIERAAHGRMDAVGRDQRVAVCRHRPVRAVHQAQRRGDAMVVLREVPELMRRMDVVVPDPGPYRLAEHAEQVAAADGELREVIARFEPARFAPDLLAEPVGVGQLTGAHRDAVERVQQAESGQLLDRMGRTLMPTPSSRIVVDCSNTSHSTPTAWRLNAVANPPMPPPAISTFMIRLLPSRLGTVGGADTRRLQARYSLRSPRSATGRPGRSRPGPGPGSAFDPTRKALE